MSGTMDYKVYLIIVLSLMLETSPKGTTEMCNIKCNCGNRYRQTSKISHLMIGNKIVVHSRCS